jgi:hypothetical protein
MFHIFKETLIDSRFSLCTHVIVALHFQFPGKLNKNVHVICFLIIFFIFRMTFKLKQNIK